MKSKLQKLSIFALALLLVLGVYFLWEDSNAAEPSVVIPVEPTLTPPPDSIPAAEDEAIPDDKMIITVERQTYQEGELALIIPKLEEHLTVYNGTEPKTLLKGVGLYEYAQLPGEGNRNVSIAGHRNNVRNGVATDDAAFYYIDTLVEGDYLYLQDSENIYRYVWSSQEIVEPDDWGPIFRQGDSRLTITSCHPLGVNDKRIIVVGQLDEIIPFDANYDYISAMEEAEKEELP